MFNNEFIFTVVYIIALPTGILLAFGKAGNKIIYKLTKLHTLRLVRQFIRKD